MVGVVARVGNVPARHRAVDAVEAVNVASGVVAIVDLVPARDLRHMHYRGSVMPVAALSNPQNHRLRTRVCPDGLGPSGYLIT